MEYYKKIWYSKDEKKIKENELLVMLDLNEGELKKMPKSDKISEKYVESVTKVNNDPFFQEYMLLYQKHLPYMSLLISL